MGSRENSDAFSDCEAEIETTGSIKDQHGFLHLVSQRTRILAVGAKEIDGTTHNEWANQLRFKAITY
jgi:hypothetical protein